MGTPAFDAVDLGMTVLGHGQTSRLHRRLVRRDELAEAASASTMGLIGGTSMGYAYARARDGVAVERVHDVVLEEVERIVADGITETELRRAKAQFERHWLHELARIDSRADAFGEFATLYGDPELVNVRLDQIDAVDTGGGGRRPAVGPRARAPLDPDLPQGELVTATRPDPPRHRPTADPGASRRSSARRLSNGIELHSYHRPGQQIVAAHLVLEVPLSAEPREREGVATITTRCLDEGTRSHAGEEFAELLETEGAGFGVEIGLSGLQAVLDVPVRRLDRAFELFAEAVIEPALAADDVTRHVQLRLAEIEQGRANSASRASHRVPPRGLRGRQPGGPDERRRAGDGRRRHRRRRGRLPRGPLRTGRGRR